MSQVDVRHQTGTRQAWGLGADQHSRQRRLDQHAFRGMRACRRQHIVGEPAGGTTASETADDP